MYEIGDFKILDIWFDKEKSKVKVKALTLTNSRLSIKSYNQKMSKY